ncbi:MAG: hypothetical protein COA50_05315 [Flavobacteriaceae bacterium]|nr:MAG: hypothetical protein COA50_05315 [Flavobacteriaceae bacterium]
MKDGFLEFEELGVGSRLNRLSGYIMRETQEVYDALEINFDPYLFPIFKLIIEVDGITTTHIQEALKYTQPAITQSVKKLTNLGYVTSTADERDGRKKIIRLSSKGKNIHKRLVPVWKVIETEVKMLTQIKTNSLVEVLEKIELALQEKSLNKRILEKL